MRINWSSRAHDYTESEIALVGNYLRSDESLTQSQRLKQFESDFADYLGVDSKTCFGVTNCANALELSATLLKIKEGDEVIVPNHTYCASAIPFARRGAAIKWADIDSEEWVISAKTIEPLITEKTKAIVVVHLYGLVCDMQSIMELSAKHNIPVVEDCAQALGASYQTKKAGTFGSISCFSFHAQKNISTFGEGGMIVLNDPSFIPYVFGLRHNGHRPFVNQEKYWIPAMSNVAMDMEGEWPFNFSLSEIQALIGSALLKRLDQLNAVRRSRQETFRKELKEFPELKFQKIRSPEHNSYHLLPAYFKPASGNVNRNDLIDHLSNEYQIKAIVQYYPLSRYDLFKSMNLAKADTPNVDEFFDNMVSFPFHVWMSEDDFNYMIESTKKTLNYLRTKA